MQRRWRTSAKYETGFCAPSRLTQYCLGLGEVRCALLFEGGDAFGEVGVAGGDGLIVGFQLEPAPAATPLIAARIGFSVDRMRTVSGFRMVLRCSPGSSGASPMLNSVMSAPEQNALPAPVRTMTRTAASRSAARSAAANSCS